MPRAKMDHIVARDAVLTVARGMGKAPTSRELFRTPRIKEAGFTNQRSVAQFIRYNVPELELSDGRYYPRGANRKATDYTEVQPGSTVYTIEVVLDRSSDDVNMTEVVEVARSYGAAEITGRRIVAEAFDQAAAILSRRALR